MQPDSSVWFGLLGPLSAQLEETELAVPPRLRSLLAALLLKSGRTVPVTTLAEWVWNGHPTPNAAVTLRSYAKRLRLALGPAGTRIVTRNGSYLINVAEHELDLLRFEGLVGSARLAFRARAWQHASDLLTEALGLWRGEPLADIPSELLRAGEASRLDQMRLQALEWRIDADIQLGYPAALVPELESLIREQPFREVFRAQLMLVLYRSGRQAEALAAYHQARQMLVDALGVEPGAELQELHQQILNGDLAAPARATSRLAPGGAGSSVPRQLPASVRHFVGRADDLGELTGLLDPGTRQASRAAVISAIGGTAGVGKTALAVHWAHQVADRFPDGQLYVNLRGYDPGQPMLPAEALAGFLLALGVPGPDIPPGLDERAALYRSLLSRRRIIVVLDNASEAEQVRPLLPGTASCVAVVTSRDSLAGLVAKDGALRLDLDVLPLDDAVSLLRALIGRRVQVEPGLAAALAMQCCRLPLALRIAAEIAIARPVAQLADLIAELGDERRLDLLDASGDARAAMRAVFSWSYRHLSPGAARAFRLVGQHPGTSFDSCALAALAGLTIKEARHMLDCLARAYLIHPAGLGRYGMHDLLRIYARDLAAIEDLKHEFHAALGRVLDYYLQNAAAAAETLFPAERHRPYIGRSADVISVIPADPAAARAWLDGERANLVAVVSHAAEHNWPGHAAGLAAILHRYLDKGGYYTEAAIIHNCARRAARGARDRAGEATALVNLATVGGHQGSYQHALGQLSEALALFREIGDMIGEARVLGNLGVMEFYQGCHLEAGDHLRHALALHREAGDLAGEALTLGNLGTLDARHGRYVEAQGHIRRALAICEQVGNTNGKAHALEILGEIHMRSGQQLLAADCLQQALDLARQTGNRVEQGRALCDLGLNELRQGRSEQAAVHLQQALEIFREIGERSGEIQTLIGLGEVDLADGCLSAALDKYASALALAGQIKERYEQARAHDGMARAYDSGGDHDHAREHLQAALVIYAELDVPEADRVRSRLSASGQLGGRGPRPGPVSAARRLGGRRTLPRP